MSDQKWSRRSFLAQSAAAVAATSLLANRAIAQDTSATAASSSPAAKFTLPELGYSHDALASVIDAKTMEIHHGKHHQAYVDKLNAAVAKEPSLAGKSAIDLIKDLASIPEAVREDVRNNGGGHVNHSFFWQLMIPGGSKEPTGDLGEALLESFGNLAQLKRSMEDIGTKQFGSGWVWLVIPKGETKMKVVSTPNQDNPISEGHRIILGNDVWEHAYYLKYQNRRADYLKAWWDILNWDKAEENYQAAIKG